MKNLITGLLLFSSTFTYSQEFVNLKSEWIKFVENKCKEQSGYKYLAFEKIYESSSYSDCKEAQYSSQEAWSIFIRDNFDYYGSWRLDDGLDGSIRYMVVNRDESYRVYRNGIIEVEGDHLLHHGTQNRLGLLKYKPTENGYIIYLDRAGSMERVDLEEVEDYLFSFEVGLEQRQQIYDNSTRGNSKNDSSSFSNILNSPITTEL